MSAFGQSEDVAARPTLWVGTFRRGGAVEDLWKAAFGIAGLGGIASFVVWSLYRQWLQLPIFQQMTKKQQFRIFVVFLVLTFFFGLAGLGTYAYVSTTGSSSSSQSQYAKALSLLNVLPGYGDQQGRRAMNRHELLTALKQMREMNLGADFKARIDRLIVLTEKAPAFPGNHYDMRVTTEMGDQISELRSALRAKG